jgi:sterol desaturase/sphingolipid hydroxylase (fatty acid hydroxylase superfamily)
MQVLTPVLNWFHTVLVTSWAGTGLSRLADFLTGPLTGMHTRYGWVFLAESAILLTGFHFFQGGSAIGLWRRFFPPNRILHPSTIVDVKVNIGNALLGSSIKILWRFSAPGLVAASLLGAAEQHFGPAPHLWHFSLGSLLLLTFLVMLADDLGYYAFHLASHRVPVLWSFHKLHHSAEVLTPLVAGRVHPVEIVLSEPVRAIFAACVLAPALYFFAGDANLVTVGGISLTALIFGALGNQLLHSEVPLSFGPYLDRVLVSPAVHQIHHSALPRHFHRNLGGLLSVWDWMFGTLHVPQPGEHIVFGLQENEAQIHTSLLAAYCAPFQEVAGMILRPLWAGLVPQRGAPKRAR